MKNYKDHITVCICTFKRKQYLQNLLEKIRKQVTNDLFRFDIVLVDNDKYKSAEDVYFKFQTMYEINIKYFTEPIQNIALARNKCIVNAKGNYVAFIDDDELPLETWLLKLYKAIIKYGSDGVLGPVIPKYIVKPPTWILKGKFYERPKHKSGQILKWENTRTGNALLKKDIFESKDHFFREEFGSGGEDRDLFRRLINKGFRFVWCADACVFEIINRERYNRSFLLRRALLRGQLPHFSTCDYLKSIVAIPIYFLVLPTLIITAPNFYMKFLVKIFDHIGRLITFFGFRLIKQKYIIG